MRWNISWIIIVARTAGSAGQRPAELDPAHAAPRDRGVGDVLRRPAGCRRTHRPGRAARRARRPGLATTNRVVPSTIMIGPHSETCHHAPWSALHSAWAWRCARLLPVGSGSPLARRSALRAARSPARRPTPSRRRGRRRPQWLALPYGSTPTEAYSWAVGYTTPPRIVVTVWPMSPIRASGSPSTTTRSAILPARHRAGGLVAPEEPRRVDRRHPERIAAFGMLARARTAPKLVVEHQAGERASVPSTTRTLASYSSLVIAEQLVERGHVALVLVAAERQSAAEVAALKPGPASG